MKQLPLLVLLLFAQPVLAYGPGMHAREADLTLDMLMDSDPFWAEAAQVEWARPYLTLGSISPDFQFAVDALGFGHSKALSYHLLAKAADMPVAYSLFALGHLTHAGGGDPASEQFVCPTAFALEPLGMFDIIGGYDGPRGESEGICEGFGDLMTGNYHRVADAIWYFWLEGDDAKTRGQELIAWYCAEGSAFSGTNTDCDAVWVGFQELLNKMGGLFAGFDYEGTHDLVDMLLGQSPQDLADLAFAGSMGGFVDFDVTEGEHTDAEKERIKNSILMDHDFWAFYEDMALIGPSATVYFYQEQPPAGTWPTWSDKPQIFGNIRSVMNFLPDRFAPWPGLLVDEISFRNEAGSVINDVGGNTVGATVTARVRFYASFPVAGTVKGVVRRDRPGFAQQSDDIVGEATIDIDVDPASYGAVGRDVLEIPFVAEPDGALGFYVELYFGQDELPWFSTSWDGIWPSGVLPFDWETYRLNFGTYDHWPPSLPVEESVPDTVLMTKVRVAPAGPGIAGATVTVDGLDHVAGDNGIVALDGLDAGAFPVLAGAAGYAAEETVGEVTVVAGETAWHERFLHATPDVVLTNEWTLGECAEFAWDEAPFAGQAESFHVVIAMEPSLDGLFGDETTSDPSVTFCTGSESVDDQFYVGLQANYGEGSQGPLYWSGPFLATEVSEFPEVPLTVDYVEAEVDLVEQDTVLDTYEVLEAVDIFVGDDSQDLAGSDAEVVEVDDTPKKSSSGCAAASGTPARSGLLLLLAALLVIALHRKRSHNI